MVKPQGISKSGQGVRGWGAVPRGTGRCQGGPVVEERRSSSFLFFGLGPCAGQGLLIPRILYAVNAVPTVDSHDCTNGAELGQEKDTFAETTFALHRSGCQVMLVLPLLASLHPSLPLRGQARPLSSGQSSSPYLLFTLPVSLWLHLSSQSGLSRTKSESRVPYLSPTQGIYPLSAPSSPIVPNAACNPATPDPTRFLVRDTCSFMHLCPLPPL